MALIFGLLLSINLALFKPVEGLFSMSYQKPNSDYIDLNLYENISLKNPENIETTAKKNAYMPSIFVEGLFWKYGAEYGVDSKLLQKIAFCESGYNSKAINGPFVGMFQFMESTWVSNRKAMGLDANPDLRFDAKESVKTTAFKISRDGVGAWPVCGKK